jgi:trehalose 6-phosphate synthase/phosphatase
MRDFVAHNTAAAWADRFLTKLAKVHESQRFGARPLKLAREAVPTSPPRVALFLFDYAGTLRPHVPILSEAGPESRLRFVLTKLARRAKVYVMSGQPPEVLDAWFDGIPIGLVCEDGLAIKDPGGAWPELPAIDRSLLEEVVEPVMRDFYEHTPGSKLERKRASLAWRFRLADPGLGPLRAKELYAQLEDLVRGLRYSVLINSRAVEVRPTAYTETSVALELLSRHPNADLVPDAGRLHGGAVDLH